MSANVWAWVAFATLATLMLVVDLFIINRKDHEVSLKESAIFSTIWISIGLLVGVALWIFPNWFFPGTEMTGGEYAALYFTAFIAEKALSVDNLFVFIIIFAYFATPKLYQSRALAFGILGALVLRAIFIFAGTTLLELFAWLFYVLGAILIYTAVRLVIKNDANTDPNKKLLVRFVRKLYPVTKNYQGHHFFVKLDGKRYATPFLLVVVAIFATDIVFAIDSIPTVFSITSEPFIVWSSNVAALLGLRMLFFLVEKIVALLHYMKYALAAILAFIGVKLIVVEAGKMISGNHDFSIINPQADIYLSLGVVLGTLFLGTVLSLIYKKTENLKT